MEERVVRIEDELSNLREDVVDSKNALFSISKDIHIMSQTSLRMEGAITKLLESEVRFQLHAQEDRLVHEQHNKLINALFQRIEKAEEAIETSAGDHEVVERISSFFWKTVGWFGAGVALAIVLTVIYAAEQGVFSK